MKGLSLMIAIQTMFLTMTAKYSDSMALLRYDGKNSYKKIKHRSQNKRRKRKGN